MATLETSFVLLKPDAVQRGLVGQIISRFEGCGLRIVGMKMLAADKETLEQHYAEHKGKGFFPSLIEFMNNKTVVILAIEGANAISNIRKLVGSTEPAGAAPGTIRGDFCHMSYARSDNAPAGTLANVIHASDGSESANRELSLWFEEQDICHINNPRCDQFFM
ncbi:nucleoside-diphosphate kinase [Candidatus Haliotispira prima]|uniref:Nucleoside diphosphate kinase n=1 Tax=Candidatus Haliotispira prima TaxID=3034016 RepID=A0ABY8MIA1_9SPIO|nr:nucleoside-diphosphate kinase [Candidatus Haliotispira prima]